MLAEWLSRGTVKPPAHRKPTAAPDDLLLVELSAQYKTFAKSCYRKVGELSGSIYVMLDLVSGNGGLLGEMPAAEFDSVKIDTLIRHIGPAGQAVLLNCRT
jgi:hypothetical protein